MGSVQEANTDTTSDSLVLLRKPTFPVRRRWIFAFLVLLLLFFSAHVLLGGAEAQAKAGGDTTSGGGGSGGGSGGTSTTSSPTLQWTAIETICLSDRNK